MRIDQLRAVGVQLSELERRKALAVSREDYDAAKLIKDQLAAARQAAGVPPPPPIPPHISPYLPHHYSTSPSPLPYLSLAPTLTHALRRCRRRPRRARRRGRAGGG